MRDVTADCFLSVRMHFARQQKLVPVGVHDLYIASVAMLRLLLTPLQTRGVRLVMSEARDGTI